MKQSKKLQEIFRKNREFEKESPYNFCDRWCERCPFDTQKRCTLYRDEFEQKITCIAHGRDENDPEITAEVMKQQFKETEDIIREYEEEFEIDLDGIDDPEFEPIKRHIEFVENNPLALTAEQYRKKAHTFLKNTFYKKKKIKLELTGDFETVAWYHTLLSVKLQRALCGFHEPAIEGDSSLYDAVAQFEICRKAAKESIFALRTIKSGYPSFHAQILELLALLHNILSRIELTEEQV